MKLPKMLERDHAKMIFGEKIFATRNHIGDLEQRLALLESRKRKLGLGVEQSEISHEINDIKNRIANENFVLQSFNELFEGHNPLETLIHQNISVGASEKKPLQKRLKQSTQGRGTRTGGQNESGGRNPKGSKRKCL